jgi:transcription elongation factor Elf1
MTIRTICTKCSCERSKEILITTTRNHGVIRCAACGSLVGWQAEDYAPPASPWGKFKDWWANLDGDVEVAQTYKEE